MKNLIFGLLGAAIGFAGGYLVGKIQTEKRNEQLKEQLDEYYDISDGYCRKAKEKTEDSETVENEALSFQNGKKKEKVDHSYTDYSGMYHTKIETEESMNKPKTDAELSVENHEKNREKEPKIIQISELDGVPRYIDRQTLYYYMYDHILTDEDDNIIDTPEIILGTCLEDSNFMDNDDESLFVRNFQTDCVYIIEKQFADFS